MDSQTRLKYGGSLRILFVIIINLMEYGSSTPVYPGGLGVETTQFQMGRNIRHLPCVARKTNAQGVCMFAIDCLKANGTHLGTCIDRFYFGSCCQLKTELIAPDHEITDNSIEETTSILLSTVAVKNETISLNPNHNKLNTTVVRKPIDKQNITINSNIQYDVIDQQTTKKPDLIEIVTLPTKFSTFQFIEDTVTTTPSKPSTTKRATKPPKTKPTVITTTKRSTITTTHRAKPSKPTNQRTTTPKPVKATKRPIQIVTTTAKPRRTTTPKKATVAIRTKPTRKTVITTTSRTTLKPTVNKKPVTLNTTKTPLKPINLITTTSSVKDTEPISTTHRIPLTTPPSKSPDITTTEIPEKFSTVYFVQSTKAPRPKPKPTSQIVKITTTTIKNENGTESTTIQYDPVPIIPLTTVTTPVEVTTETMHSSTLNYNTDETTLPTGIVTWTNVQDDKKENNTNEFKPVTPDWILISSNQNNTEEVTPTLLTSDDNVTSNTSSTENPSVNVTTQGPPTTITSELIVNTTVDTTVQFKNETTTTSSKPIENSTISTVNVTTTTTTPEPDTTKWSGTTTEMTVIKFPGNDNASLVNETLTSTTVEPELVPVATPSPFEGVDYKQICGKRMFPEPRIVGGAKAAFGRWPWQISLRQWRTSTYLHKCGAALLNENWAITAAHCVDNVPPSDLLLRLGEYDLAEEEEPYGYQERRVQIVASHPQFDSRTFEYDLALLRFYEPVVFQPNIIPVCVPDTDENFIGRTAHVTGWGRLYEDGPLPSVLQEVTVPVINNTLCENMYRSAGYIEHIPHIFICAGWTKGGYDSCEGDSGGPMVIQRDDKRYQLAGIISWGIGCAEPNQPGVYTRISEFRDWINQILQF